MSSEEMAGNVFWCKPCAEIKEVFGCFGEKRVAALECFARKLGHCLQDQRCVVLGSCVFRKTALSHSFLGNKAGTLRSVAFCILGYAEMHCGVWCGVHCGSSDFKGKRDSAQFLCEFFCGLLFSVSSAVVQELRRVSQGKQPDLHNWRFKPAVLCFLFCCVLCDVFVRWGGARRGCCPVSMGGSDNHLSVPGCGPMQVEKLLVLHAVEDEQPVFPSGEQNSNEINDFFAGKPCCGGAEGFRESRVVFDNCLWMPSPHPPHNVVFFPVLFCIGEGECCFADTVLPGQVLYWYHDGDTVFGERKTKGCCLFCPACETGKGKIWQVLDHGTCCRRRISAQEIDPHDEKLEGDGHYSQ